ncbi:MAG: hypothetical protein ACK6EB_03745 [Planctomyces sp.]|jgi:hypothetical protein
MSEHLIVSIDSDYCENPAESECNWRLISYGTRHVAFEHPDTLFRVTRENGWLEFNPRDPGLRRRLDVGLAFHLSYYEHGLCSWFRKGCGGPGTNCRFDGVVHAGLLVFEHGPSAIGAKTYAERAADADRFLKQYTDWCNGNGLSFTVRTNTGDYVDGGCGGYYGSDYETVVNHAVGAVSDLITQGMPWTVSPESLHEYGLNTALRKLFPTQEYKA